MPAAAIRESRLHSAFRRVRQLPRQLRGQTPFGGDCQPARVPLFALRSNRPTLPFPHPWNYQHPLAILESYFTGADSEQGPTRHNRYLEVPGCPPVLVTRDPAVIRAILTATGDRAGQFDRDTLPSTGIARATGPDTLLFANGTLWRRQRKSAASPFGKTSLFQPEMFQGFEGAIRQTIRQRLEALRVRLQQDQQDHLQIAIEPEIKAVMLEMLVRCFFGAEVPYERLRNQDVPAIERIIDHIVRDTVVNRWGVPMRVLARCSPRFAQIQSDFAQFDDLTSQVLAGRATGAGLWKQFHSDVPDAALCSNLKGFLAGALEATTSYATWTISHLARSAAAQEKVFREVCSIDVYTPDSLAQATYLNQVLEETLRLTPSLYFLPRRATVQTTIETADGRTLIVPRGTHLLLDVWHANRHEDHWGRHVTGFPADEFVPERWENVSGLRSKELLHFGFGHGARVCPGKHLGQLEVALVVGAFVKLFRFQSVHEENPARAGVSTKPADGTLIDLTLRTPAVLQV